jgi:hypothetical protein
MKNGRSKKSSPCIGLQETAAVDWTRLQILLVHGTYAEKAPWTQKGSPLRDRLTNRFPGVQIKDIRWGGKNSNEARFYGSYSLLPDLIEDIGYEGDRLRIAVCHSHGGQILVEVLRTLKQFRALISGVVFFNTPFLHGSKPQPSRVDRVCLHFWSLVVLSLVLASFGLDKRHISFLILMVAAVGIAGSFLLRKASRSSTDGDWYWAATRKQSDEPISTPVLAITCSYDEPLLFLRTLSGFQRWLLAIYLTQPKQQSNRWLNLSRDPRQRGPKKRHRRRSPRNTLSRPVPGKLTKETVVAGFLRIATYPIRPLLPLALLTCSSLSALAFGHKLMANALVTYAVSKKPPSDFAECEFMELPPVGFWPRHSGVYRNPEAIEAMADWIEQTLKSRPPQHLQP